MKRNTRWYLSAAAAGALLAGAALWAARTFPAAPVAKFLCEVRTVCCKVHRKSSFSGLFSQFS